RELGRRERLAARAEATRRRSRPRGQELRQRARAGGAAGLPARRVPGPLRRAAAYRRLPEDARAVPMIPQIGHLALVVALMLAALQACAVSGRPAWPARRLAQAQFAFVALAFACLVASFAANDFSVLNVATNSNSKLPLPYRVAASWGSHEGSL